MGGRAVAAQGGCAEVTPRLYQVEAAQAVQAQFRWSKDIGAMLCMATGTGKTFTALRMAVAAMERGRRVLMVSHRRELVRQPVSALAKGWAEWAPHTGIIQGPKNQASKRFVSASVDTLVLEGRLEAYLAHGVPSLVIWDEAHHTTSPTQLELRERLSAAGDVWHLGLTATPEGLGLADLWRIVYSFDIRRAQAEGYLLPERFVVERLPDLVEADYRTDEEEGQALLTAGVVEHTVTTMEAHARGRSCLVFTANVVQADLTAQALCDAGFRAVSVSGSTAKGKRAGVLKAFQAGEIDVIVNAAVFTEGTDLPRCDCVVLARSCRSKILFIQTVGRGLRLYPGQKDCLVLDLAGASLEHQDLVIAPVLLDSEIAKRKEGDGSLSEVEGDETTPMGGMRAKREPIRACWVELDGLDHRAYAVELGSTKKDGRTVDLGRVIVVQDPHSWRWSSYHAVGASKKKLKLLADRVELRHAQAMGNDLVRRASALSSPFTAWRKKPATPKQKAMAAKLNVRLPPECTSGKATDLIGAKIARSQVKRLGLANAVDVDDDQEEVA